MIALGGLQPFTTIDFPGRLAAVLFCQGCPWRCGYCHNPALQGFDAGPLSWDETLAFLRTRAGRLDGVVFSGGEPTAARHLPEAIAAVRALGFEIGLHTAAPNAGALERVLPLVDWVGLDVKAPWARYAQATGLPATAGARPIQAALAALIAAGTEFEVRTTVDPALLDTADLEQMATELATAGLPASKGHWVLQRCRDNAGHVLPLPFDPAEILNRLRELAGRVEWR